MTVTADQRCCLQSWVVAEVIAEVTTEIAAEVITEVIGRMELEPNYNSGNP